MITLLRHYDLTSSDVNAVRYTGESGQVKCEMPSMIHWAA